MLVVDSESDYYYPRIRGLFAQTYVERQLGNPLPVTAIAQTLSEQEQVVAGH